MKDIESESKFIWKFIFHILITPITLLLIAFKKKEWKDLLQPLKDLFEFVIEPKFTFSIIIINSLIFVASAFFLSESTINSFINYPSDLLNLKIYTLITAGFLHANVAHLVGNMLGIFIFGRVVEQKLGFLKTSLIYFGALVISSLLSSMVDLLRGSNVGGLGASGALMGLVSVAILLSPFYLTYELIIPLPIMLMGWLAIYGDITGILNPVEDGIGHIAHLGGFISIGMLMFFIGIDERSKLKRGLIINIISLLMGSLLYFFLYL